MALKKKAKPPNVPTRRPSRARPAAAAAAATANESAPFAIVGIGASAGGLEAFTAFLTALPADTGLAYVLVSHLAPSHESMLPEILSRSSRTPVTQVTDHTRVEPNRVYVIPPGSDMELHGRELVLSARHSPPGPHRTIDHFFRSLAETQGYRSIGVVLSGTANDGTLGLEEIKAAGGLTFAQDESAQQDSMPRSAIEAGCVDVVLPPGKIAREIARIARHRFIAPPEPDLESEVGDLDLAQVIEILRKATDADFSGYKRNTFVRRIARRIVLHKLPGTKEYLQLLKKSPDEVQDLFQDVLIGVTSFFRNPEAFEALKAKVFPKITQKTSRLDPVRIWVQGCSTGEEAYSLGIALTEFAEETGKPVHFQLFATDLNAVGIQKARAGVYGHRIAQDVTAERLQQFFREEEGGYRVDKSIRERCVFAQHNVLTEPPFSHIELVSCRNLLIYLDQPAQQRLIPIMHYALNPGGFLWLGGSETIGSYRDLFELEDSRFKIYSRKALAGARYRLPLSPPRPPAVMARRPAPGQPVSVHPPRHPEPLREADGLLLARYAPASVLINTDLEVLQFRGDTSAFLTASPGKASLGLLKMLREGLLVGVRAAIARARKQRAPVRQEGLRVRTDGSFRTANVEVIPLPPGGEAPQSFLVVFEAARSQAATRAQGLRDRARRAKAADEAERGAGRDEVRHVTRELEATREYLQTVIEQQETANEELQAANEEVQSSNEELQSINEELETSKEEIQSSNEELSTVNDELQQSNAELTRSIDDIQNLLSSVQIAIVILGPDLRIRRFTPMAGKMLNLLPQDVGRPIGGIRLNLTAPDIEPMLTEVIRSEAVRELEVQDANGRWYSMRLRPYRTVDDRIDGAVLVLVDVDALKRGEEAQRQQNELLDQTHEPIIIWDFQSRRITYWNRGAESVYGYTRDQAVGQVADDLLAPVPSPQIQRELLKRDGTWTGELAHRCQDGTIAEVESRMVLVQQGSTSYVIETNRPIGERLRLERALRAQAEELRASDRSRSEFLGMLAHELRSPLTALRNVAQLFQSPDGGLASLPRARAIMTRQIRNMARMIDDLLDVTRIARGQIELRKQSVNLGDLVSRVADQLRDEFNGRGQRVSLALPDEDVNVEVDETRLEQVFSGLLATASRFATMGGQVWVTVEGSRIVSSGAARATPSGVAMVRISDTGSGTQPLLPRVFDVFVEADKFHERTEGASALGLALLRRVVELHGGSVEAASAGIGQGTEFVVRLPAKAPPLEAAEVSAGEAGGEPCRILIVDDHHDVSETMALLLKLRGHEVAIAHDGASALRLAVTSVPRLVLLDIGLPDMDGFEVATRLRREPSLKDTRLVALSGYRLDDADTRRAREVGFDKLLTKPVDPEMLDGIVASLGSPAQ